jgi:hypothetical protein
MMRIEPISVIRGLHTYLDAPPLSSTRLSSTHVGARPRTQLLQVHQTSLAEPPPVSEKHGLEKPEMRCQGGWQPVLRI